MKMAMHTPNIIIVLCDDLGYGDLGCYGNEVIATPHLDALAAGGLRCTDFYASAAWCMPSRKGLMTGVHPYRGGIGNPDLLRSRTMLPEMLGRRGYASALIGKWHLGMEPGLHPLDQGFDYFYGTRGSNDPITVHGQSPDLRDVPDRPRAESDWPVSLLRNRDQIEHPARQSLFTRRYTEEAIQFINKSRTEQKPFFLYLAHNMPHVPLFTAPPFAGKSRAGLYGDVVEELDWSMGEIVRCLDEQGLREDTLILFTSDNGPWCNEFGGSAGPLRGEKGTGWEGGPRVPAMFSWPGRIAPGVTDAFMVNLDLYATLAAITGAAPPSGYPLDKNRSTCLGSCSPAPPARAPATCSSPAATTRSRSPTAPPTTRSTCAPTMCCATRSPARPRRLPNTTRRCCITSGRRWGERRELSHAYPDLVRRLHDEFNAAAGELDYE